jgi:phage anti-repressor protein
VGRGNLQLRAASFRAHRTNEWYHSIHKFTKYEIYFYLNNLFFVSNIYYLRIKDASRMSKKNAKKPHGFWLSEKGANMRKFFLNFAKENKFEPLKASGWYNYNYKSFANYPV